jgi:hypothetical protein
MSGSPGEAHRRRRPGRPRRDGDIVEGVVVDFRPRAAEETALYRAGW